MGNSNALATGLVSFLELTTQGRGPGTLTETISGEIDLQPFLALTKRQRFISSATVNAGGNGPFSFNALGGNVPAGEAWLLYAMVLRGVVALGTTVSIQPAVQLPMGAGNESFPIGEKDNITNATAANAIHAGVYFEKPLVLPPNSILGGVTSNLSAAVAINLQLFADIVRVRL